MTTAVDPDANGWAICDPVVRLRRWGSDEVAPIDVVRRYLVGSSNECALRIDDARVSRRHAVLAYERDRWWLRDAGSTNGITQDGERRAAFHLAPGDEIGLGDTVLVAESERSIALGEAVRRWLGWASERRAVVDRALRAIREMATRRTVLVLVGAGDLTGAITRIHRAAIGDDRPVIVHAARETGVAALARARGGTLVLRADALPDDLPLIVAATRLARTETRIIIHACDAAEAAWLVPWFARLATIEVPALAQRADEQDQLLASIVRESAVELGGTYATLRERDLAWLRDRELPTIDVAELFARRLVALRTWGVTNGADRLGLTHGALSRWARRQGLAT